MFDTCISRILPPNEQILEAIVRENPVVTKGVEEMDGREALLLLLLVHDECLLHNRKM